MLALAGTQGVARYMISHLKHPTAKPGQLDGLVAGRFKAGQAETWVIVGSHPTAAEAYHAASARGDAPVYGACPTDFPKVLSDRNEYAEIWAAEEGKQ